MTPSSPPKGFTLKSFEFRREREASWRELERILAKADRRGTRVLEPRELERLPTLYQATLSSLSVARAVSLDQNLLAYLEGLCERAYFCVYAPRRQFLEAFGDLLARGFPRAVRRIAGPCLASGAIFLLGFGLAFALTGGNHNLYESFVPAGMAGERDFSSSRESLEATLFHTAEGDELAQFSGFLFSNNASVGLLCFGVGFLAGIPTIILLFQTGLMLGAMSALFHSHDLGLAWWSWILPHGVTELLAIILCGGAGLEVARALVFPGRKSRLAALSDAGPAVGAVVVGCIGMLFIAGIIEGVFRQTVQDLFVRYGLAFATFGLWTAYFGFLGRRPR